jgi:hypothetical protein
MRSPCDEALLTQDSKSKRGGGDFPKGGLVQSDLPYRFVPYSCQNLGERDHRNHIANMTTMGSPILNNNKTRVPQKCFEHNTSLSGEDGSSVAGPT